MKKNHIFVVTLTVMMIALPGAAWQEEKTGPKTPEGVAPERHKQ